MELSWTTTATLGIILIIFFKLINKNRFNYWKKKGVPVVPSTNLIIGPLFDTLILGKSISNVFEEIYKSLEGKKYGGTYQFFTPLLMVRDIELINQILIKDFTYFEDRGPPPQKALDVFSTNIFNLSGDEWRIARHKLTPTFTSGKLKIMFGSIKECCQEGISFIKNKIDHEQEARCLMGKFVTKIAADVGFGLKTNTFNEEETANDEFVKYSSQFIKPTFTAVLRILISLSFPKLTRLLKLKIMDEKVNNFFLKTSKDVIKYREETGTRRNDFLQIMIDERKKEQLLLNNENKTISCDEDTEHESEDKELLDQLKNTPISNKKEETSEGKC